MNDLVDTISTISQSVATDWTVRCNALANCIRNIRFVFCGMLFLFYSCASIPQRPIEAKLDLSEERQLVEDLKNIDPYQKQIILSGFDKADTYTESIRIYAKDLEKQNGKLKSELLSEKEDAAAYRRWRNWALGIGIGLLLWQLRGIILPIVKRFMGIPV